MADQLSMDFMEDQTQAGFRLKRLEVYNWGTFDKRVWNLDLEGANCLLTGDIGSGKSTMIDAVTTLLVPSQRVAYNKAAGGEARERTLRSYVLGYYKSERSDLGSSAKPVALRGYNNYSVILGVFVNKAYKQVVTLAQVFWMKESKGQPTRFYVATDKELSITSDFSGFGSDISGLRRILRKSSIKIFESFPPYGAWFRRRFGIASEQALELFHQTVSLKSVGNLTGFVRSHMLEPFDVQPRITALLNHFDDLNRAHLAVVKAKKQIELLTPLVDKCELYDGTLSANEELRCCRDLLRPWFAEIKADLLIQRIEKLKAEYKRQTTRIEKLESKEQQFRDKERELRRNINENGGDRIQRIEEEIAFSEKSRDLRKEKFDRYGELLEKVGMFAPDTSGAFLLQRSKLKQIQEKAEEDQADVQNKHNELAADFKIKLDEQQELEDELSDLRSRRSNINRRQMEIRRKICAGIGVREEDMPFAGELIQVRDEERDWQGAIERVMHNFGLSLLVPDSNYAEVVEWVDRNHLRGRLVYFRVRNKRYTEMAELHPDSLVRKIAIKHESSFYVWLEDEIHRRFDIACCETQQEFRREAKGLTKSGQIKMGGERHEKDDRHRLDDRSRYILGWSNEEKISALEEKKRLLEIRAAEAGTKLSGLQKRQGELKQLLDNLNRLDEYREYEELDWQYYATRIENLAKEKKILKETSDLLNHLTGQLSQVEDGIQNVVLQLVNFREVAAKTDQKVSDAEQAHTNCLGLFGSEKQTLEKNLAKLESLRAESQGDQKITVESCDAREREMREWLQKKIDSLDKKANSLRERIVSFMTDYNYRYELETREVDSAVESADEYREMLAKLQSDDLPRFEERFKELLNENTIREVANFQSQLIRERETIKEKIDRINESLTRIDYNRNRYIVLEAEPALDQDIRDFRNDLRACTEGTLTGSDDAQYSEKKFIQVRTIIERFKGREGQSEADRRWTGKVTDVRNWFTFAASERWREDNTEFEHYTDSGGKSGGQKEKLAYTVLAASLAYQFGLKIGEKKSRSFRFVVIDEAFGRGSDESATYGLKLFKELNLQLLIVTPLQKIHIIEPFVAAVGFVHNHEGQESVLRTLSIEEYRKEREAFSS